MVFISGRWISSYRQTPRVPRKSTSSSLLGSAAAALPLAASLRFAKPRRAHSLTQLDAGRSNLQAAGLAMGHSCSTW
jgi:hypothetical protein